MTMHTTCTYRENRGEMLIAYLYNDIEPAARAAFDAHLAACAACRQELEELGHVRARLELWAPPEPTWALSAPPASARSAPAPPGTRPARAASGASDRGRWGDGRARLEGIPAWARFAAAVLFVGVSAAVANLHVTYDQRGLTVRTGWLAPPADAPAAEVAAPVWRAELAALQQQLRDEIRSAGPGQPPGRPGIDEQALLGRVRTLIQQSEQRQQRELALRIAEVDTSVRAQRAADLRTIGRNLNEIQNSTGVDMMRLYRMTNDLAVRVSQNR